MIAVDLGFPECVDGIERDEGSEERSLFFLQKITKCCQEESATTNVINLTTLDRLNYPQKEQKKVSMVGEPQLRDL